MSKLLALWKSMRTSMDGLKGRRLNRMPNWYLVVITAGAGSVQWATWKIIDPAWTEFFGIWEHHPWDASATRAALLVGLLTLAWAYHAWLTGTHSKALFDKGSHDRR